MASQDIIRMTKRMLDRVKNGDVRKNVLKFKGQIFIWKVEDFKKYIKSQGISDTVLKKLVKLYREKLQAQDSRMMQSEEKERLQFVKDDILDGIVEKYDPATMELYAVRNYHAVNRIKAAVGTLLEKETGLDKAIVTGRVRKGTKAASTPGDHIGHGEFGHAVSTTKVFAAESVMRTEAMQELKTQSKLNANHFTRLENILDTYKKSLDIQLGTDHYQEVSARGNLDKSYTAILSSQGAGENLNDALGEKEAIAEIVKALEEEYEFILNQPGSPSLLEGIEQTTLYNLTKSKGIKLVKGKASAKVKSQSKGNKKSTKVKVQKQLGIIKGSGAVTKKAENKQRKSKGVASQPLQLIGILNKRLPDTVRKNMRAPGLENQTGRFAESVKLTDVIQTPKGFPSIGYTYQKAPYQVFEMGRGTIPWATPERDPRKVIDQSIRELAAQFAIGRFYTRRV